MNPSRDSEEQPSEVALKPENYVYYKENSSPEMRAVMRLVSDNRSLLKTNANLQSHKRAKDWTVKRNKKLKKENHYHVLPEVDYDGDDTPDIIVTKNGKIYSFNGYMPKENDWPLRGTYLSHNRINEDTGKYYGYTKKRFMNKEVNRDNPSHIRFPDPEYFTDKQQLLYPAARRYNNQVKKTRQSIYMTVVQSLAKDAWTRQKKLLGADFPKHIKFADVSKLIYTRLIIENIRDGYPELDSMRKDDKTKLLEKYWDEYVVPKYPEYEEGADYLIEQLIAGNIKPDGTEVK